MKLDDFATDWKDIMSDKDADSSQIVIETDEDKRMVELIDILSDTHREVLILHYFDNLDSLQIAEVLDIPGIGTVKSRLFHARKQLSRAIEGDEQITKSTE
ncbi:MAG: RNA polymerase sigma factor [Caldisericia bacterium]